MFSRFILIAMAMAMLPACQDQEAQGRAFREQKTAPAGPVGLMCESTTLHDAALQIAVALCPAVGDPEDVDACRSHLVAGFCEPAANLNAGGNCDAQLCGSQIVALDSCLDGIAATGDVVPACTQVFELPAPPPPPPGLVSLQIDAATGRSAVAPGAPTFDGNVWSFGTAIYGLRYPLPVQAGDVISAFRVFAHKATAQPVTVFLERMVGTTGYHEGIGPPVATTQPTGISVISQNGIGETVLPGTSYSLRIYGSWVVGDKVANAEVDVIRP